MQHISRLLNAFKHTSKRVLLKLQHCRDVMFREENLYFVNVPSAVFMTAFGDFVTQSVSNVNAQPYDIHRTGRMALSDGYFSGNIGHFLYRGMDKFWPGEGFKIVMKKMVFDQLVIAPCCLTNFYFTMGLMSNSSVAEIIEDWRKNVMAVYVVQFFIWVPAQLINFYFIRSRYRMIYINTVSLLYAVYISHLKFQHQATKRV